jgi:hypothetical protein
LYSTSSLARHLSTPLLARMFWRLSVQLQCVGWEYLRSLNVIPPHWLCSFLPFSPLFHPLEIDIWCWSGK